MATIIDALIITLGLDPRGVSSGMANAQTAIQDGGRNAAHSAAQSMRDAEDVVGRGVQGIMGQLLGPLAALAAGAMTLGAILQRIGAAADLGKLSRQLRTNVEDLQAWQGAAVMAGGSAQGLLDSAKALREKTGSRMPITDQLLRMADHMRGLSEVRALELGNKMGLDEGTVKLLRQGRQAVQALVAQQRELVAFSRQDVATVQSLKKAYESFKAIIFMVGNVITKLFLPPLRLLAEKLQSAGGVMPWFVDKLTGISRWVNQNGPQLQNVFVVLAAVLTARMVPALWATARAALAALLPFLPFIALVAALALVFDDLMTYIDGGDSLLANFWSTFGTGPEIAAKFAAAWEGAKGILASLLQGVQNFFAGFQGAFSGIKTLISGVGDVIAAVFTGSFERAGAGIAKIFTGLMNFILGLVQGMWEAISGPAKKLLSWLPGMGKKHKNNENSDAPDSEEAGFWEKATKNTGEMWKGFTGQMQAKPGEAVASVVPLPAAHEALPGGGAAAARGSSVQTETHINQINIQSQATDAAGIAKDAASAVKNTFNSSHFVNAANSGVGQK